MDRRREPEARPAVRRSFLAWATVVLAVVQLAASTYAWYAHASLQGKRVGVLVVGEPLPEIVLWTERGRAGLRGFLRDTGMTLVVFYTPTCAVCPEELEGLLHWLEENPEAPLRIVVVADEHAKPEDYPSYSGKLVWLRDPGLRASRHNLRIGAVPSYALVDGAGVVRYVQRGKQVRRGENLLLKALDRWLGREREEGNGH